MKKHLLVAAFAALALASTARAAEPVGKPYLSANLGLSVFHDNDISDGFGNTATVAYKSGLGFAGALGYKFNPNVRGEFEIAYRKNDVNDIGGDTSYNVLSLTVMNYGVNVYYDFVDASLPLKPFIGAGIGYASAKLSGGGLSESDSQFAYQAIVGVAYPFDPNGNITFQYRYHSASDFSKDGLSIAYGSSTFLAGITYAFSL
jgi:opacity protein-like surface antigen